MNCMLLSFLLSCIGINDKSLSTITHKRPQYTFISSYLYQPDFSLMFKINASVMVTDSPFLDCEYINNKYRIQIVKGKLITECPSVEYTNSTINTDANSQNVTMETDILKNEAPNSETITTVTTDSYNHVNSETVTVTTARLDETTYTSGKRTNTQEDTYSSNAANSETVTTVTTYESDNHQTVTDTTVPLNEATYTSDKTTNSQEDTYSSNAANSETVTVVTADSSDNHETITVTTTAHLNETTYTSDNTAYSHEDTYSSHEDTYPSHEDTYSSHENTYSSSVANSETVTVVTTDSSDNHETVTVTIVPLDKTTNSQEDTYSVANSESVTMVTTDSSDNHETVTTVPLDKTTHTLDKTTNSQEDVYSSSDTAKSELFVIKLALYAVIGVVLVLCVVVSIGIIMRKINRNTKKNESQMELLEMR